MRLISLFLSLFVTYFSFSQTVIPFDASSNNQTFSTCNGFIIDSGGQGGQGYSNGENVTITICPGTPGDIVSVVFNLFDLNLTDDNPNPNVANLDYMEVYDGPNLASPSLGSYSGNDLQGVVIQATILNPSGCLTFRFTSNTIGTGMFTASASCETPCATPFAGGIIAGGITSDSTVVCVDEIVNFQQFGSFAQMGFNLVDYTWDFMDGSSATGQNVSHSFDIPGQYRVQLYITDDNGCGNTNLIDLQVFVGTIPTFEGFPGDTSICLGENLSFTTDPNSYEVLWDGFTGFQSIDDGCLPDTLLGVSQDIQITQTGFNAGATIQNVNDIEGFCLDLEHTFMGDLVILVECPNGQNQIFHQQGGGGTQIGVPNPLDNVDCSDPTTQGTPFTYCFTPTATETWVEWVANSGFGGTIPGGNYEPVQPFTNLLGCPLNGIWTLTVIDNWAADDGTLFAFDINMDASLYAPVTQFQPQIGLGTDSSYWSTPATFATVSNFGETISINPTSAGTFDYVYNVTDSFGCSFDSTVTVVVTTVPTPDAGPDVVICDGIPVQLNGTIAGGGGGSPCDYTFNLTDNFGDSWNGNNLIVTINGVVNTYTVSNAQATNATYTLSIPHGATVNFQFDGVGSFNSECEYEIVAPDGTITFADGGNFTAPSTALQNYTADCFGGYDFVWSPAALVSNANIPDPMGNFSGPGVLTLSVFPTGHPLCAVSDQLNFSLSASAFAGNDAPVTICSQAAPLDLFPLLGTGVNPTGTWKNGSGAPTTMPYDPITMNPGTYTYSVDSNGCISSAIITVTEINTTVNVVPTASNCHGLPNGSAQVTTVNASSYSLNGGTSVPYAGNTFNIPGLLAGNYTLIVSGSNGCSATTNFTITEPVALAIQNISNDITVCSGTISSLTATGSGGSSPYIYSWIGSDGSVTAGIPANVTTITTTSYCLILSEVCGSQPDTSCMTITIPQNLIIDLIPNITQGCEDLTIDFTNQSNGATIITSLITFGDGESITLNGLESCSHEYVNAGIYTITVTSTTDIGCVFTKTYTNLITVFQEPIANFTSTPNPVQMFSPQVTLVNQSSSNVVSYSWNIESGNPGTSTNENFTTILPEGVSANYQAVLAVATANGCVDTSTQIIYVAPEVICYAPNTFTPDDDEFNQTWRIFIAGIDEYNFSLQIFNRWGEIIWESSNPNAEWDGTYKGKIVPQGTYTWRASAKALTNDKKHEFGGHISIIQ